jgi:hypothetical protein
LTGLFLVAGCRKDNLVLSGGGQGEGREEEEPEYPIEIPFTEYSLAESCQWTNLAYDNTVIIINSDEELENYVACMKKGGYSEIDFSKNSLLLTSGSASREISNISKKLWQLSPDEYKLNIEILLNDSTAIEKWAIALIVEKVSNESHVELNVTEYPIDIPFTEYFIHRSPSLHEMDGQGNIISYEFPCWKNLNHDYRPPDFVWEGKISVINNDEELENYLTCPEDYPEIDFSKQTLVLASGSTTYCPISIRDIAFVRNSVNQYTLSAAIWAGPLCMGEYWCMAILTPKVEEKADVILSILYSR